MSTPPPDPPRAFGESLELIRRGRAGDHAAFAELIRRYQDRVRRLVSLRMGRRFDGLLDSLDLTQDTWLAAFRGLPTFEPRNHGSIIQWLVRIAENQVHDAADRVHSHKRDRRREVPRTALESRAEPAAPGPSPSQDASGREVQALYDACVAELSPEWREVVLCKEYMLLDWPEICERTGRPNVHAAQELYRRAQLRLGALLKQRLGP